MAPSATMGKSIPMKPNFNIQMDVAGIVQWIVILIIYLMN
jgi:hypothetical protein